MVWKLMTIIFAVALLASCNVVEQKPFNAGWAVGLWRMTADEDNVPLGEIMEFTAAGGYAWLGRDCVPYPRLEAFAHNGDIYVTNTIADKGPVAIIFHPNADRTQFTYTSPRTKNNATYQRVPGNKCVRQS